MAIGGDILGLPSEDKSAKSSTKQQRLTSGTTIAPYRSSPMDERSFSTYLSQRVDGRPEAKTSAMRKGDQEDKKKAMHLYEQKNKAEDEEMAYYQKVFECIQKDKLRNSSTRVKRPAVPLGIMDRTKF